MIDVVTKLFVNNQIKYNNGQLEILGLRDSFTPTKTYVEMLNQLIALKKENLIYWSAKSAGIKWFERMAQVFPGIKVREATNWGVDFISLSGWGITKLEKLDLENNSAVFTMSNSVVVKLFGQSNTPLDHLFRGLVAGALSYALKTDIDGVEVACASSGSKFCKFLFAPKSKLNVPSEILKKQLSDPIQ